MKEVSKMEKMEDKQTQDILLTEKQQELLKEIVAEKSQLQSIANEIAKREVLLSSLVLDGAGVKDEDVESAQLNEAGDTLTITKK